MSCGTSRRAPGTAAFDPKPTLREPLLDHLVSTAEQWKRDGEAERLRGLEVGDQLDFCGLLDRQVGGLGTFEDSHSVGASLAIRVRDAASVAHQTARRGVLAPSGDRWNRM